MDLGLRSDGAATLFADVLEVLEGPAAENPHTNATGKSARERNIFIMVGWKKSK